MRNKNREYILLVGACLATSLVAYLLGTGRIHRLAEERTRFFAYTVCENYSSNSLEYCMSELMIANDELLDYQRSHSRGTLSRYIDRQIDQKSD